ncbi:MAG TPA: nicotinate (nicotinamide) nucleotide adenylyltransferase [Verrucomicrobiae bacterium]|jgi:nicotinate-nucleotide adenylyltransferase
MKKIGLFGGSFDPVHLGHLLVAEAALEEIGLERLFFIPAAQSPFKPGSIPAPAPARLKMLRLALAGQTRCEVDLQEIERGGISYTIETVRYYSQRYPGAELYYLIGADHIPQLPKWREAETLSKLVEFVVIPRPGQVQMPGPTGFRLSFLRGFPLGISSSQIRARVQAGQPLKWLVPDAVEEAIRNNGLYV